MKLNKRRLTCLSMTGLTLMHPAMADLLPNGDFELSDGASWEEANGGGSYVYSYPGTGGNDGGYGVIDNSGGGGGFGLWVSNSGVTLSLDSLGLEAGRTYNFMQDMILLSGSNMGGFKVDFFNGADSVGTTGDLRINAIDGGSAWSTYQFPITIPANADGIKAVPLWGVDSSVGFDNIGFDPVPIEQSPIPNNDFELGASQWFTLGGGTTFAFPATGGNPDGHAVMTNDGSGFGIMVANGNTPITLESLGIEAGTTVTFQQDMKLISGSTIGGMKIEFFNGDTAMGDTGDMPATLIGNGSTWETYSFEVSLPGGIDRIKIVPLWGAGSSVGYDNIRFISGSAPQPSLEPRLAMGTLINWTANDPCKIYQPQSSSDGMVWQNLGPAITGDAAESAFDLADAAFYRVVQTDAPFGEAVYNGGLELTDFNDPTCADGWTCLSVSGQFPTLITSDAHTGNSSFRLAVQNNDGGSPNNAEIQHNIAAAGGTVTPGETYTFSFWAKQISSGVSYVQNYRLQWLDINGVPIAGTAVGFTSFSGGNGVWSQIIEPNLVAPPAASGALIEIFGATGAVAGATALGEVLIDDVSLALGTASEPVILDTTREPGTGLAWITESAKTYQAQASANLEQWEDIGGPIPGNGGPAAMGEPSGANSRYYRFILVE